MSKQQEQLHQAALMSVACNTIMLEVCDNLTRTTLYKQDRKQRINALTKDLEGFNAMFYKGISDHEEQQYMTLVRTVESAAKLIAKTPIEDVAKLAAFLEAWQSGSFAEVEDEKLQGMLKCGMLKLKSDEKPKQAA